MGARRIVLFILGAHGDVLGAHMEVVTHAVGRICCSNGVPLGDMEECVASSKFLHSNPWGSSFSVSTEEIWEPLMGPKLTERERQQLTQFLKAYRNCFAFNMKGLGALIGLGIRIESASDTPIFHRPYRYTNMERDLIQNWMLDLLDAKLMKLSHGEYASAIVMLVKKDVYGNYTDRQMCGHYRPINWQIKSNKYAMPTPEEIFDVMGHAKVLNTLDLRIGYHWLPIQEEDKAKSSFWGINFHGKDCLCQWKFLPFWVEECTY